MRESGYTLGSRRKIAHSGSHAETGAFRTGPLSLPSAHSARSRTSPGRVSERQTLPLLGLGRGCAPEERREPAEQRCAYARRCSEASRPRWAALLCLQLGDVAVLSLCAQYFLNVRGGGGITTLGVLRVLPKFSAPACQNGSFAVFCGRAAIIDSSGAKAETASHSKQPRFPVKGTGGCFCVTSWSVPGTRRSALSCRWRWGRNGRRPHRR